jgi:hypothetical protein
MVDDMRLLAPVALAALLLAGCGGSPDRPDGDGPAAPTVAEFCGALTDFQADFADADPQGDLPAYVEALKGAATRLDHVGTPEEMSKEARQGFDLTIERITSLPERATTDDLAGISDVTADQQKLLDELDDYIKDACPDLS